jgi:hypothetical protein
MAWKNKNDPSVVNDPTYLEPRVSAVETKANNNATSLTTKAKQSDVDTLTTQMAEKAAISYLSSKGGGTLRLQSQTYLLGSFTLPDGVVIKGQGSRSPSTTNNATILQYTGNTGTFIKINSYYNRKAQLIGLNLTAATPSKTASTIAILIKLDSNAWGASANIENVGISGFGVGIRHQVSYLSTVKNCSVTNCGIGISYMAEVQNANPAQVISSTFGNENTTEHTTVFLCNVGYEFASDINNTIRYGDIEQNTIGILFYKSTTSGMLPPQNIFIENMWLELNTKYVLCNCQVDGSLNPTQVGTVTTLPTFKNCWEYGNVTPEIPNFNANYDIFSVGVEPPKLMRYSTDEAMTTFYGRTSQYAEKAVVGNTGAFRKFYNLDNTGLQVKMGFNNYQNSITATTTGVTTQTVHINYSSIINPEASGANNFSSMALMNVTSVHNDGAVCSATFIISDFAKYAPVVITQLGTSYQAYGGILSGTGITTANITNSYPTDKAFDVQVTANIIKSVTVKINFLPNGLLSS